MDASLRLAANTIGSFPKFKQSRVGGETDAESFSTTRLPLAENESKQFPRFQIASERARPNRRAFAFHKSAVMRNYRRTGG